MSNKEDDFLNSSKRESFRKYLNDFGVIETLTNVITNIYKLEIKPTDPLDYIRTHMTDTIHEKEELKTLRAKHNDIVTQIQKTKQENINLAKEIKELQNYENELNRSKLVIDEIQ